MGSKESNQTIRYIHKTKYCKSSSKDMRKKSVHLQEELVLSELVGWVYHSEALRRSQISEIRKEILVLIADETSEGLD